MSKKSRERKLQKVEKFKVEQAAITDRKKSRIQPLLDLTKKFAVTLLATIILLVIGYAVNKHLPAIVERIMANK